MRTPLAVLALATAMLVAAALAAGGRVAPASAQTTPPTGGGTWQSYACADCVVAFAVAPDAVWAGTNNGGVVRHDRRTGAVRQFTRDDGLGGNAIYRIQRAPDGDVWATHRQSTRISKAATMGISRFDGQAWRAFDVSSGVPFDKLSPMASCLATGSGGTAWVVADGRLFHFDGTAWQPAATAGLPGGALAGVVVAPDGTVWTGGEDGMARRVGARWEPVPSDGLASPAVIPAAVDTAGTAWAWVQTDTGRFNIARRVSGTPWEVFDLAWPGSPPGTDLSTGGPELTIADDGTVWAVFGLHARRFDGRAWLEVTRARDHVAALGAYGQALAVDPRGGMWIGYIGGGISHWDGSTWTEIQSDIAPSNHVAFALAVAPDDSLWAGYFSMLSPDNIVNHFDGRRWVRHDSRVGMLRSGVLGVVQNAIDVDAQGRVWVGVDRVGMAWRDRGRWSTRAITDVVGSDARIYSAVGDDRGGAWFGTSAGAVRFDGQAWRKLEAPDAATAGTVYAVAVDRRGGRDLVWFGTDAGLTRWDPKAPPGAPAWRTFTTLDGLASNRVYDIALDPRNTDLWLVEGPGSAAGAGVTRFDSSPDRRFTTTFTTADGLGANRAWGVDVDARGNVWVATTEDLREPGVSRWDGSRWRVFTTADGLIDDIVFAVAADSRGKVWVATLAGISAFVPDDAPAVAPTPTPAWGGACVCAAARDGVPTAVIDAAVADPAGVSGWRMPLDPGKPAGPFNPLRTCLSLSRTGVPYHSLFNPVTWRAGCP